MNANQTLLLFCVELSHNAPYAFAWMSGYRQVNNIQLQEHCKIPNIIVVVKIRVL